jgi:hypothetical protein
MTEYPTHLKANNVEGSGTEEGIDETTPTLRPGQLIVRPNPVAPFRRWDRSVLGNRDGLGPVTIVLPESKLTGVQTRYEYPGPAQRE